MVRRLLGDKGDPVGGQDREFVESGHVAARLAVRDAVVQPVETRGRIELRRGRVAFGRLEAGLQQFGRRLAGAVGDVLQDGLFERRGIALGS
jgi:hypothetical protein